MLRQTTAPSPASLARTGARPPVARRAHRQREVALLLTVQRHLVRPRVVSAACGMSRFGDHALGWLALGALGALADRRRRRDWLISTAAVAGAHGTSIVVKRVVRRRRPLDPAVQVLVSTPSRLSFPSSHATSTTAAAMLYGHLLRRPLTAVLVPPMLVSRLVVGVHYPSDVLVGSILGAVVGAGVRRRLAAPPGGRSGKGTR